MGFWQFFTSHPSPPTPNKRLAEIEERLESLERANKSIKLEWEEAYDKLHHLMSRVTKRAKDLSRAQGDAEKTSAEPEDAPGAPNGDEVRHPYIGMHGTLQEMRRRHGLLPR